MTKIMFNDDQGNHYTKEADGVVHIVKDDVRVTITHEGVILDRFDPNDPDAESVDSMGMLFNDAVTPLDLLEEQGTMINPHGYCPPYVPQGVAIESMERLSNIGMGKPGAPFGNTLWAMVKEACQEIEKLREELESE